MLTVFLQALSDVSIDGAFAIHGIILRTQKMAAGHAAAAFHKHCIKLHYELKRRKPFHLIDCRHRDRGMRIGGARPHLSSDPDGLHQLLAGHAMAERGFRVSSDAMGGH
jgi:hypothetical protein